MDREPTYGELVKHLPADVQPYLPQRSGASGDVHIHVHHHAAPAVPDRAGPRPADDRGWLLLHRLIPYLVVAALCAFIICGSIAILAWTVSFVLAALLAIVASAEALAATAVGLVAVVAVLAAVIGSLFKGPSTTVNGSRNRIGKEP